MPTPSETRDLRHFVFVVVFGLLSFFGVQLYGQKADKLDLQSVESRVSVNLTKHIASDRVRQVRDSAWKADVYLMVHATYCKSFPRGERC